MAAAGLFRFGVVEMPHKQLTLCFCLVLLGYSAGPAHAYIGPGAGAGTIAVVLGVLASVAMAFFAILWYPIKRVIKKRKAGKLSQTSSKSDES